MIRQRISRFPLGIAVLCALFSVAPVAAVTCTPGSGTVTCTGGTGAHVTNEYSGNYSLPITTVAAQTGFGTTIPVTGGGAAVQSVSITLHGYTSLANLSSSPYYDASADIGLLLVSPSGRNMEILHGAGGAFAQTNMTVTLADGGATLPNNQTQSNIAWNTSGTYAPCSYPDNSQNEPNYSSVGAPALAHAAASNGTATLNSVSGVFTGDTINGNWKLYLVSDSDLGSDVQFSSWDITITYTAASTPSTTTLSPNPSSAFTSSPNNSVALTATVTSGATGTVIFRNGANTISGCGAVALSGGQAVCNTTFTSEGLQSLSASYSGDGTYVPSSGTANVFTYNHATNTATTYCNTGTISGASLADVGPYPSVIDVGDGVNTSLSGESVDTVSISLKNFSSNDANGLHMLLVSPDGSHALDFWGEAGGGAASAGNYTIQDGSSAIPNSPLSPGTYSATANFTFDTFVLGTPIANPAPQPPTTFSLAEPAGSKTFQTSFVGATANGKWLLYVDSEGATQSPTSATMSMAGGWCIDISPALGKPTTVSVQSSPVMATKGAPVTFTATVSSSPVANVGQVTFTENGTPLTGAPNGGVANVSNGVATILTSGLPEGDHTITASYHDSTGTYNDNFGTVTMRVDAATPVPTLSASTWSYCNTSGITIPAGMVFTDDLGPAAPNPSNIFVTNLPGTISTASVKINNFFVEIPGDLETLLVGPNGASVPTAEQTLDFFSPHDDVNLAALNHTVTFADIYAPIPAGASYGTSVGTQVGPTSNSATSYTASPFYTLPGTFQHATTQGAFTFNTGTYNAGSGGGVFTDTLGNGTWSLYFDQTIHHTGDGAASWCMNFVENPVTITVVKAHAGSAPSNHFVQGEQNAQFTVAIQNNGPGPTGDPDNNHPLTVTDVLNSAFTLASTSGTGWSCTGTSTVICTNHSSVAQGDSYPTLTIDVNVSNTATPGPVNNTASVSGGGVTGNSGSDSVTIDPAPVLAVTKTAVGTFTQGQTAEWDIVVSNTAAGSNTGGTTTVSDTLPSGYTISSTTASGWNCSGSTSTTLSCTSTQVVAGGAAFNTVQMFVHVPAASPTSVTNTVSAFGGGDLTHTNSGTATTASSQVTVVQVPATVTINGGGGTQSAQVSTAFATALSVTVKDANNVVIPTYSVTFTAVPGGSGQSGTFSNSTGTISLNTDVNGIANAGTFTANANAGAYTVTATAGSITATFNLTNTLPPPALAITKTPVGTFTQGQTAEWDIAVSNTGVAASVTAGTTTVLDTLPTGYTLSSFSSTGNAWACVGTNVVTCTSTSAVSGGSSFGLLKLMVNVPASSATTVTNNVVAYGGGDPNHTNSGNGATAFSTVNNVVQVPATVTISGGGTQSAFINTAFSAPLAVLVKDAGSNVIPNQSVTFTAPASGASGTFSNTTNTITGTTNSSGVLSETFTANGTFGAYNVTATAGSVSASPSFALTNTVYDLTIGKAPVGTFAQAQTGAQYTITVTNGGNLATNGTITVTDTLPTGFTYSSASAGWTCGAVGTPQVVTCTNAGPVPANNGTLLLTLTTNIANNAPTPATNAAQVACACTPAEPNTGNNSVSIQTAVTQLPNLTVAKTHSPANFTVNDTSDQIPIAVSNSGSGASSGTVTVTDTLPTGLTFVGSTTPGWSCSSGVPNAQTVKCLTTNAIAATNGTASVTINVSVASSTSTPLINNVSVACTCAETSTSDNSNTDSIPVLQAVNITLATSPTGLQISGDGGSTFFTAPHTFAFVPNSQHTIATQSPQVSAGVQNTFTGWSDSGAISHTITVPATDTTYTASFTTTYQLTVNVSPSGGGTATPVSGGYYAANTVVNLSATPSANYVFNNWSSSPVTVAAPASASTTVTIGTAPETVTANFTAVPDLTISKTNPGGAGGHFSQGQTDATYTITVGNAGLASTAGLVSVTENPGTGLTLVSMSGTGWLCGPPNAANVCTRTDVLGTGSTYLPITVVVSVSATAPVSVVNSATVAGGGEVNTSNDTAMDTVNVNPISDVTSQVNVTQTGFAVNRATHIWSATLTVTNKGATTIAGPVQVVLTDLTTPGVTMTNNTGLRNGNYYITVTPGSIAPNASANVVIQFTNPNSSFITFTPVTESGTF